MLQRSSRHQAEQQHYSSSGSSSSCRLVGSLFSATLLVLLVLHDESLTPVEAQLEAVGAVLSVVPVTNILATAGLVGVKLAALSRLLQVLGYDRAYLASGGSGTAAHPIGLQTNYAYMFPYVPGLNISVRGEDGTYRKPTTQQANVESSSKAEQRKTYPAMGIPGDYENQAQPFRGSDALRDIFHNAGINMHIPNPQQLPKGNGQNANANAPMKLESSQSHELINNNNIPPLAPNHQQINEPLQSSSSPVIRPHQPHLNHAVVSSAITAFHPPPNQQTLAQPNQDSSRTALSSSSSPHEQQGLQPQMHQQQPAHQLLTNPQTSANFNQVNRVSSTSASTPSTLSSPSSFSSGATTDASSSSSSPSSSSTSSSSSATHQATTQQQQQQQHHKSAHSFRPFEYSPFLAGHPIPQHAYFQQSYFQRIKANPLEANNNNQAGRHNGDSVHLPSGNLIRLNEHNLPKSPATLNFEALDKALFGPLNPSHDVGSTPMSMEISSTPPITKPNLGGASSSDPNEISSNLVPTQFGSPPYNDDAFHNEINMLRRKRDTQSQTNEQARDSSPTLARMATPGKLLPQQQQHQKSQARGQMFGMPAVNINPVRRKRSWLGNLVEFKHRR